jgi:formylglycine-generating enzyme required for sulfatase activity
MIELADIPAGNFVRGGHTITLSAFKMSKFQVTQELYEAVMGNNPSWFQGTATDRVVAAGEIQGKRPVETVTWFDAVMFCNKLSEREGLTLFYTITSITMTGNNITAATVTTNPSANGYRLPTEAQWEYACRAGSTTLWHFGDDEAQLVNYAWYSVNSNSRTHQVGLKLPNEFGLYDMHGNVWEWVWDFSSDDFPDPSNLSDPTGAASGSRRVVRGGSWDNSAQDTRSANRVDVWPYVRDGSLGFRFVRP